MLRIIHRVIAGFLLKQAGLEVEVIPTPLHPIVLGRRRGPKEWPHIVLYGHYDVQPADPLERLPGHCPRKSKPCPPYRCP